MTAKLGEVTDGIIASVRPGGRCTPPDARQLYTA
jgi:hypothetical protein